jgi:hypothetical protein
MDYRQQIDKAREKMEQAESTLKSYAHFRPRDDEEYARRLQDVLHARTEFIRSLEGLSASISESTKFIYGLAVDQVMQAS